MALSIDKEKFHEQFSTNVRVLIIDHDINFLNDIEKKCTQYHYSVKTCSTISEASDILIEKKDCFDVILIEAKMLDLDSYDFVQFVTQQMNIPAIMMCVDDTTSVVNKAIDKGACDFWIKPFSENNIKIMWQHVARKVWNEAKKDENLKVKGKKARENDKNEAKKEEKNEAKKERVVWTPELHKIFVTAVKELNLNNAVPLKILEKMNVPGLSRENVASHLQKFRQYLKTKKEQTGSANVAGYNYNSQEFDFQAYYDATRHLEVPRQIQNQMPYGYNSSQQVTNNLMSRMLPNNAADAFGSGMFMMNNNHTFPMQQEHRVHQMSLNFVNQPNYGGFGSNSVINSSFNNTIDAAYFQNPPGGSFFLGGNSHQIPMTQPLLMSSSMIGATPSASGPSPFSAANVGDMNAATLSLSGPSLFSAANVGDMNAAMTSLSGPSLFSAANVGDMNAATLSLSGPSPFSAANVGDMNAATLSLSGPSPFSAANVGDMNAAMTSLSGPSPFSAANVGDMNAATTSSSGLSPFSAANVGDMNAANTILTEEDIAQLNFLL